MSKITQNGEQLEVIIPSLHQDIQVFCELVRYPSSWGNHESRASCGVFAFQKRAELAIAKLISLIIDRFGRVHDTPI